jgi:hypothetical protein
MWSKYKLEEEKIYSAKLANMRFWIQKYHTLWRIVNTQEESLEEQLQELKIVSSLAEELDWTHLVADKHDTLIIQPALPDKAVIIRPIKNISVLPSMKIDIVVRIPLWLQFYTSSVKPENLLLEFPGIPLSSTWFGEPDNGELAYRLPQSIHFSLEGKVAPYEAICPVRIQNESTETLHFQRLSVPANQLNLYINTLGIFSNEVRVEYTGDEKMNTVNIVTGGPAIAAGSKLIAEARSKHSKNLLKKSFHLIKSFTQY